MTPAAGEEIGEGGVVDPRRLLPVLTAVACALVVATLVVVVARPDPPPRPRFDAGSSDPPAPAARPARAGPAAVLAAWDERRSAAWAEGDVAALEELYVDGSGAGAADVRLLRDYRRRGLRVEGLATQVLALRVDARSSERLELVVTDRVVGAEAVGAGEPVALPVARPSTRRVVLVREDGSWLVAEVRDQDSAAASTSRTSSSSKS
ncbi:hypothetical protein [uncultured Nocardioides sp.]|uniref:hypothetical protein n=1 Tax=uncultured Nocardioides sp. TaxID=198441 RepID=UPI00262074DA|nr:hypothetical protein [uncultured Nocardioides sp.]